MDRAWPHAGGIGRRHRHRRSRVALRAAARLHARRLRAPARHRAPSRRVFGRHAGDRGTDRTGCRAIREDQFRHPARGGGKARAAGLLDLAAGRPGGPEPAFPGRGLVQSLCRARASHLRRRSAGLSRRAPRDDRSGVALSLVRAVRLGVLSSGRGLALRGLWHTRYHPPLRAYPSPTCGVAGGRADDRRTFGEDRALSAAFVAAPGPRQCARARQRHALEPGGQGVVLSGCPALVRRAGASPGGDPRRNSRRPRFSCDPVRQRARVASGAAETAHRLFDRRADRLPVPHVSAWSRAMGGGRFRRRNHAGSVARVRQGGDVPVRGPRRRIPWPRPHRRPRRRRSRDASHVPRPGSRRAVAHGAAAKRRLRRQVAPDEGLDRGRPMGVGGCHGGRRIAGGRISLPGARPALSGENSRTRRGRPRAAARASRWRLALVALLLAFAPQSFFAFLQIGRPAAGLALQ